MKKFFWLAFIAGYFAVYASIFPGDFHYDDYHSIRNNGWLTSAENIPRFFADPIYFSSRPRAAMYRPLLLVSYALDYQIYGWRPWGWHLTNLLLHLGNVILVWILMQKTFGRERLAWIAALLFAFQPVAGENINYINCRSSILLTTFILAGLVSVCKLMEAPKDGRGKALWISLASLFFVFGLLSKEGAVIFPALAFLYCGIFSTEKNRKKATQIFHLLLPMLIILCGYLFLRFILFHHFLSPAALPRPRLVNLFTQLKSYFWYFGLYLYPVGLSIEHSFKVEPRLLNWPSLLSLAGLTLFAAFIIYSLLRPKSKFAGAGFLLGFYVLALLPVASIVPLNVLVSERGFYPALFGLCAVSAFVIDAAFEKSRKTAFAAFAVVLLCCSGLLVARGRVWQQEPRIWADAYTKAPDNARVLGELGRNYFAKREDEKALRYILKADELQSREPTTLFNLATIYMDLGRLEEAEKYFKQGLEKDPSDEKARVNLAEVYKAQGKPGLARFELERAISLEPNSALAHSNLGSLYLSMGELENAEAELRIALKIDPDFELAHYNLGQVLDRRGAYQEALEHFQKAYQQNSGYPDNALWAGIMLLKLNQPDKAEKWAQKALALDQKYYMAWYYLGLAEKEQGKNDDALAAFQNALKYSNPADTKLREQIKALSAELAK